MLKSLKKVWKQKLPKVERPIAIGRATLEETMLPDANLKYYDKLYQLHLFFSLTKNKYAMVNADTT